MSTEVSYLISSSINLFLTMMMNWILQIYIFNALLKRKHSLIPFCIHAVLRGLLYNVLTQIILAYYYGDTSWWGILNFGIYWLYIIIYIVFSYWTFDEELLKLVTTLCLGELPIASYSVLLSAVINVVLGRGNRWVYFYNFDWVELVVIAVGSLFFFMMIKLLLPVFQMLINHLLLYRKIMWVVVFVYLTMGSCSWVLAYSYDLSSMLILFWTGVILAGILYFAQKYTVSIRHKNAFLKEQKNLMELHYATVIRQVAQMRKSRRLMEQQMEEIAVITDQEIKKKKLANYTFQVKQSYGEIQAGIYCDDWIIDSILYNKKEELRERGIDFEITLQGYDRGKIAENDLAGILIILFRESKPAGKRAGTEKGRHLKMRRVKNQLILEYTFPDSREAKSLKREMKSYLKEYCGNSIFTKNGTENVVVINLSAA